MLAIFFCSFLCFSRHFPRAAESPQIPASAPPLAARSRPAITRCAQRPLPRPFSHEHGVRVDAAPSSPTCPLSPRDILAPTSLLCHHPHTSLWPSPTDSQALPQCSHMSTNLSRPGLCSPRLPAAARSPLELWPQPLKIVGQRHYGCTGNGHSATAVQCSGGEGASKLDERTTKANSATAGQIATASRPFDRGAQTESASSCPSPPTPRELVEKCDRTYLPFAGQRDGAFQQCSRGLTSQKCWNSTAPPPERETRLK